MPATVGIDASPKRIAIVRLGPRGALKQVDYGEFAKTDVQDRVNYVVSKIPVESSVWIEGSYLGPNRRGSLDQAELIGNIVGAIIATYKFVTVTTILPAQWRSACGITGRGKQPIMDYYASRHAGHEAPNQDIADAFAIANAGFIIDQGDSA